MFAIFNTAAVSLHRDAAPAASSLCPVRSLD
jgi:hypothetical protein